MQLFYNSLNFHTNNKLETYNKHTVKEETDDYSEYITNNSKLSEKEIDFIKNEYLVNEDNNLIVLEDIFLKSYGAYTNFKYLARYYINTYIKLRVMLREIVKKIYNSLN